MTIIGRYHNGSNTELINMPVLNLVQNIDRDTVVNQLCAVIIPPLFAYVGLFSIFGFGEKIADQLLKRDTHANKGIKPRIYGLVWTGIISALMLLLVIYFSLYRVWDMAFIFVFALLGYAWVKVNTYCVHLDYTYRYIRFRSFKKTLLIPFENVSKMCWETHRGQIASTLVIYFNHDAKICLSSSDFVGLTKLKTFYDSEKFKK